MNSVNKLGVVLMVLGLALPLWAATDNAPKGKTVKVTGEGTASAAPDQAVFTVSVQQEGNSSKEIVALADVLMNQVLAKLKDLNIASKDLQTEGYSVNQNYDYSNGKSKPSGYTVTNRLKVIVRQVDQTQAVVGSLADMESVQVDGPIFGFAKPDQLQIDALRAAVANAHAKAEALAEAAGTMLGPVYSIDQTGSGAPVVRPMAMMAMAKSAVAPAPIEKGTDEVTAQVEVIYTLK